MSESANKAGASREAPASDFILVDFDGTLAAADVGNRFFHAFTRDERAWQTIIDDWKASRLTARECLARECALARVDEETARSFVTRFSLDPDAATLIASAERAGHRLEIGSDGLELYIRLLLERAGLSAPFTANGIRFEEAGPIPEFASGGPDVPLPDGRIATARAGAGPGCGRCGNCKGQRIREAKAEGCWRRTVLVGDGYSDRCAAAEAATVYAKDDLLDYCREHGIPCRPFERLIDVVTAEGWTAVTPGPPSQTTTRTS